MMRRAVSISGMVYVALGLVAHPAQAAPPPGTLPQVVITNVVVNFPSETLTVIGQNFATGGPPVVTLGNASTPLPIVGTPTDTVIVVECPPDANNAPQCVDGDFRLMVSIGSGSNDFDTYDLSIHRTAVDLDCVECVADAEVADNLTIGPTGSVADSALSGNVSLLGPSIESAEITDGTITSADVDTSQIQRRVTGTCPIGASIRTVNQDGTVACQAGGAAQFLFKTVHVPFGTDPEADSGTDTLNLVNGNNISIIGDPATDDTITISVPNILTGGSTTAIGGSALSSNTTGSNNTASGFTALRDNTTGRNNTASGAAALQQNTTGNFNTASGEGALANNSTGSNNTASGAVALLNNSTGSNNTASGVGALQFNTTGHENTASGAVALFRNTTGNFNTASGYQVLQNNSTGGNNTASGYQALQNNTTGHDNIAIGYRAGISQTTGNNNIYVDHPGVAGESGTIRIGITTQQQRTFIQGISGVTVAGTAVVVNTLGQLGVVSSSRRFKEDIREMGDASSGLMRLRPVTFRYKAEYAEGPRRRQYGLIAEEVAEVYPDLVTYSLKGEVEAVQYRKVNAMLLNEVQKQYRQLQAQQAQIADLMARLAHLEALEAARSALAARGE